MKYSKDSKKKRPLSHIPLLVFPNNSEYIMDNPKERLKEPQRAVIFSLANLHEKWKRKGVVNFNRIDYKFGEKSFRSIKTEYRTEEEEKQEKQFFDILHGIHYEKSEIIDSNNNKSRKAYIKNISKSKYNSKNSYYLSTKIPWNSNSIFDIRDKKTIDKKLTINIEKVRKKNKSINSQNKNYKTIKERYLRKNLFMKEAKRNKFIEEEKNKIYNKIIMENPGLKSCPEKINALLYKEMINLYQEYSKYMEDKKSNKNDIKIKKNEKKNQFALDEFKFKNKNIKSKHIFTDNEIFDKLYMLLSYLKENKEEINKIKFLQPLILDYNKIIEEEEYLKKRNEEYNKYIEEVKRKEEEKEKKKDILAISKYPINEKIEKDKIKNIFSYHTLSTDESQIKKVNNKPVNYFLTAYKNIFDEKNISKIKKKEKEKHMFITERSNNPYGTSEKLKNERIFEEINNVNKINRKMSIRKRPHSSNGLRLLNITFYHPGSYFLFKEDDNEYYAWSCCLNENKFSKGCSKKVEKVLNFNYNYNNDI